MAKKSESILDQAEALGLRVVIDAADGNYPVDGNVFPPRCELVTEARRIEDLIKNRPENPLDGMVYRHSKETLEAALAGAVKHIERAMKGKSNDQRTETVGKGGEQSDAARGGGSSGAGGAGSVEDASGRSGQDESEGGP